MTGVNYNRQVFLYVNEILHDVDAELLKLSKLSANGGDVNQELQTDETANNRPLMLRRVENAVMQLEGIMQAYVVGVECSADGNRMSKGDEYEFVLSFPENWQKGTFRRLVNEMHEYVVNACISDFLKSTYRSESESYREKSERSLWNVKHCVTSRVPESMCKPSGWF